KLIDLSLRLYEEFLVFALQAACNLTVLGFNLLVVLVDGDLDSLIELVRDLPEQPPLAGALMGIVKAGVLGFLGWRRAQPPDRKKRYVEKTRWLVISPAYYAGLLVGVLKGIVWDGVILTIWGIIQAILSIPEMMRSLWDFFHRLLADVEAIEEVISEFR